jgi:hypothetical protein
MKEGLEMIRTHHLIGSAIALAAALAATVAPVASAQSGQPCPSTLNPPPLSFETCQTVGGGTIASGSRVVSDPLADQGPCLTDPSFDVFNQDTFDQHATRWYDQNGNLTRRHIYDHYTFGQVSNPLAGTVVPYTQTTVENDEYAIPGDMSSGTATFTGENVFHLAGGAPLAFGNGRQFTSNSDGSLIESSGRNDFVLAFNENDPSALAPLCNALAG